MMIETTFLQHRTPDESALVAAKQWLYVLRAPVTPDRIEALAPFMSLRHDDPRWFALRTALIRGETASQEVIDAQIERWRPLLADYAKRYRVTRTKDPERWADRALEPPGTRERERLPKSLQALIWLDLFDKDTSPKAINVLTLHVPPFGNTDQFKAFAALVRRDITPTNKEVKDEMRRIETRRRKRERKEHRQAERVLHGDPAKVASFVADFVAAHGYGPTWSEVAEAHGWVRCQRETVLRDLRRSGWVTATQAERSLRPGPRWTAYSGSQSRRQVVAQRNR